MAVGDKLQTVASGVTDIRTALNTFDSSLGNGHISTLDDDIRTIVNSTIVLKNNPYEIKFVLNNGTTTTPLSSNSEINVADVTRVIFSDHITTIADNTCKDCSNLTLVYIPESVTRIGNLAFSNTNISNFENANPCSYGTEVFKGSSLTRIKIKPDTYGATMNTFAGVGLNGETCDIIVDGNLTGGSGSGAHRGNYRKLIVLGNLTTATIASYWGGNNEQLRVAGNCSAGSSIGILGANHSPFFEVMGDVTSTNKLFTRNSVNRIVHLGYNGVVTCDPTAAAFNFATKIYVGPGNSQAEDETILNQYLANTNWSSLSSVLATWWSYKVSESANPDYLIPMDQL